MPDTAVVLAHGLYATPNGKTAHGLVRGSDRYRVVAVVDPASAGRDAGEILDGRHRGIPVVTSLAEAFATVDDPPDWCLVGIATHAGHFTPALREAILDSVRAGVPVANGLHDAMVEDPEIAAAARKRHVELIDLRRPKPHGELHFWEGHIYRVRAPRIAVLGTDCALGKRTTTRMLVEALNATGTRAEMIYTGQTGWMQGARYGFVLDSTLNDYVSGELEHAIVTCEEEAAPEVMVIEGQSALRNPSGPCGSELLVSALARGVVLQHAPGRLFFEGYEEVGAALPDLADEIALISHYGARTLAITLYEGHMESGALDAYAREQERALGIPVVRPLSEGMERLVPEVQAHLREQRR